MSFQLAVGLLVLTIAMGVAAFLLLPQAVVLWVAWTFLAWLALFFIGLAPIAIEMVAVGESLHTLESQENLWARRRVEFWIALGSVEPPPRKPVFAPVWIKAGVFLMTISTAAMTIGIITRAVWLWHFVF